MKVRPHVPLSLTLQCGSEHVVLLWLQRQLQTVWWMRSGGTEEETSTSLPAWGLTLHQPPPHLKTHSSQHPSTTNEIPTRSQNRGTLTGPRGRLLNPTTSLQLARPPCSSSRSFTDTCGKREAPECRLTSRSAPILQLFHWWGWKSHTESWLKKIKNKKRANQAVV